MKTKRLWIVFGLSLALAAGASAMSSKARQESLAFYPARNSHTAHVTNTVALTFREPLSATTVTSRTLAVHAMQSGLVTDAAVLVDAGHTIVVTPSRRFHPGEPVQVSASGDIQNISGTGTLSPTVWQFRVGAQGGSGHFGESPHDTFDGEYLGSLALGDLDGDGDLDALIVSANIYYTAPETIWLNDGTGNFGDAPHDTFSTDETYSKGALGDVDGDGDLDAVIANAGELNEVWLNDGHANFGIEAHSVFSNSGLSSPVVLGDVDGDGDLDALFLYYSHPTEVWRNDGSGNFGDAPYSAFDDTTCTHPLALNDVDADGDLDAFVAAGCGGTSRLYANDGSGNFDLAPTEPYSINFGAAVTMGDFDGDGDADAAVGDFLNQKSKIWLNDDSGNFGKPHAAFDGNLATAGDLDGDGDLDLIVGKRGEAAQELWLNDGFAHFTLSPNAFPLGTAIALGDLDDDGDLDAVVWNKDNEECQVWLNRPFVVWLPVVVKGGM